MNIARPGRSLSPSQSCSYSWSDRFLVVFGTTASP